MVIFTNIIYYYVFFYKNKSNMHYKNGLLVDGLSNGFVGFGGSGADWGPAGIGAAGAGG